MTAVSLWMLAGLNNAGGGPISLYVYPFLGVMLVLLLVVGYVQRRKNGRGDDDQS